MRSEFYLLQAIASLGVVAVAAAHLPKAAPVQIPLTGQAVDAAGTRYVLAGSVTLTLDSPAPTPAPTPDPLSIAYLTMSPAVVAPGGAAVVTVVLTRPAGAPVAIALKSADPDGQVAAQMTINAGQSNGTAAVTTAGSIGSEKLIGIVATYNGQSRSANLTVRPGMTPAPTPTPAPLGPLTPVVDSVSCDGVTLTVKGSGLGDKQGELWWGGYPCLVTRWKDTEAAGVTLTGVISGYDWYGVRTAEGGSYASLVAPDEPWPEPPAQPSSRRR